MKGMLRALVAILVLAVLGAGCDAKLAEMCVGGPCSLTPGSGGAPTQTTGTSTAASTSTGGSDGGGAGGSMPDAKNCPTVPKTGDFPCDVFAVVHSVCNKCHTNPQMNGAPFQLLTYADTQQPFPALLGTSCKTDADCGPTPGNCVGKNAMGVGFCKGLRFQQMFISIGPDGCPQMPFQEGMLPEPQYTTLHSWLGNCAPPVPAGTGCGCPGNGCN
jgi:hypothetical protein